MFKGANGLNLDSKGRFAMPTVHRDALASQCNGKLVITVNN
ncbi:MAG: cell division/cell wall cluster transcriptional repressor MraZ, partial [Proteobacteria bacterium]|nr:cell division/cell wall cluster transcriptional repressor MraZ [Pseudomonadota bacterium]